MANKLAAIKNSVAYDETVIVPPETCEETFEATFFSDDSQELLLKAQENAELAKEAALGAISRAYEQGKADKEIDTGTVAKDIYKAIQGIAESTNDSGEIDNEDFHMLVFEQSEEFRQFIDALIEDKAREQIKKAREEAQSAMEAAATTIRQAEDEISKAKEEVASANCDCCFIASIASISLLTLS